MFFTMLKRLENSGEISLFGIVKTSKFLSAISCKKLTSEAILSWPLYLIFLQTQPMLSNCCPKNQQNWPFHLLPKYRNQNHLVPKCHHWKRSLVISILSHKISCTTNSTVSAYCIIYTLIGYSELLISIWLAWFAMACKPMLATLETHAVTFSWVFDIPVCVPVECTLPWKNGQRALLFLQWSFWLQCLHCPWILLTFLAASWLSVSATPKP